MKLTEMTNDQLVNIILRKDDVEARLRKEIATLQQENKRLVKVKRFRVLAIGLIIAVVCMAFIGLSSCSTPNEVNGEEETTPSWSEWLDYWADAYEINDNQRLSVIRRIDSVNTLLEDNSVPIEHLRETTFLMLVDITDAIVCDSSYEFTQMMRASAQYLGHKIFRDSIAELFDYGSDLISTPYLWKTTSDDTIDLMFTTLFPDSWSAMERTCDIVLSTTANDTKKRANIIVTNYTDTIIDNLKIVIEDAEGIPVVVYHESDFVVDSRDADRGVKRLLFPLDKMIGLLDNASAWSVIYETGKDTVRMLGRPDYFFKLQIMKCPLLTEVLNENRRYSDN